MRKIYIAGPISHQPNGNRDAFELAAKSLKERGWMPISPIKMDLYLAGPEDLHTAAATGDYDKRAAARRDTHIIMNELAAERGDALFMLPGWVASVGATAEHGLAKWVDLTVYYHMDEVPYVAHALN